MNNILPVVLATVIVVAFFALVMGLTYLHKGKRNQDLEIGTNPHMKERGITCAADDARKEHHKERGGNCTDAVGCAAGCEGCDAKDKTAE